MSQGPQDHPDADLGAYLLGALDRPGARRMEEHLARCEHCRAQVARLRPAVQRLASDVPQLDPPPQLKHRIMSEVSAQAELFRAAGPGATPARRRFPRLLVAAPAIAAVAVVALVIAVMGEGGSAAHQRVITAQVTQSIAPGGRARLVISDRASRLQVHRLPPPPAGQVYEVWLRHAGSARPQPTHALFDVPRDGDASVTIPDDLRGVRQVMVTIEPAGGSLQPTTPPVISAGLS
jgi:anti-sigma-K factor RskA